MIRTCAVDDGDINSETEIGRESHCSGVEMVKFNNKLMNGCSLSCKNVDGCNGSDISFLNYQVFRLIVPFTFLLLLFLFH